MLEIIGLFLKFGFFYGGICIMVWGCNFGMLWEDIVLINFCGCDLFYIFEYYSLVKFVIVIEVWSGFGLVVLEIKFGGCGVLIFNFIF